VTTRARRRRAFVLTIAAIITLPILFALAGGSRGTGIAIGVVLVVAGMVSGLLGRRG
jgi:hypothetical protein